MKDTDERYFEKHILRCKGMTTISNKSTKKR